MQSNKPRDPALIPTELLLEPPPGVRGVEVVFPKGVDFPQEGLPEPLLVFDREFTIGVQMAVAADLAPGAHTVPFTLRYQACNDKVCFAPASAKGEWTFEVVPAGTAVAAQHAAVLAAHGLRHRGSAGAAGAVLRLGRGRRAGVRRGGGRRPGRTRHLYRGGHDRRLPRHLRLHDLHRQRRGRRHRARAVRRPRPAGHPAARAPRRSGAQPHAVRAADDSHQPRHHRRGRAGRLPSARLPARRSPTAARWPSSTACSAWWWCSRPAPSAPSTPRRGSTSASRCSSWCWRWRCSTCSRSTSRASRAGSAAARRGSFGLAFTMGAVAALLAGACVAPVVIQVVLFASNLYATGTSRRAGAAVLPGHRHGHPLADRRRRTGRRCPSPARGWCG